MDGTLLDGRGEVNLPRLERDWITWIKKGFAFLLRRGNEIHRMHHLLGPFGPSG